MRGGAALRDVTELGGPEFQAMLTAIEASVDVTGPARSVPEDGAQRTAGMLCRVGRGSRLGERTLGHCDPGVSFAVILRAFCL